jgi:hypothetical protein
MKYYVLAIRALSKSESKYFEFEDNNNIIIFSKKRKQDQNYFCVTWMGARACVTKFLSIFFGTNQ